MKELCIVGGSVVYCEGALQTVREFCIVCESFAYGERSVVSCEGALYSVWELCIL